MKTEKIMTWVASPPASGKTYVSKALCEKLSSEGVTPFYIDKDSVIPLSKEVFHAGGAIVDRSSSFFEQFVRDAEYEAALNIAEEGLLFSRIAVVCAPFTREARNKEKMDYYRKYYADKGIRLFTVWVYCPKEVCKKRMTERNSERDISKLKDFESYAAKMDFSVPFKENPKDFFVFDNSSEQCFKRSLDNLTDRLFTEYAVTWHGHTDRV